MFSSHYYGHLISECRSIKEHVSNEFKDTTVVKGITKKKTESSEKNKKSLSLQEIQEDSMMGCEIRITTHGFEMFKRSHGIEKDEEAVSTSLVKEDIKIGISKRISFCPHRMQHKLESKVYNNGLVP